MSAAAYVLAAHAQALRDKAAQRRPKDARFAAVLALEAVNALTVQRQTGQPPRKEDAPECFALHAAAWAVIRADLRRHAHRVDYAGHKLTAVLSWSADTGELESFEVRSVSRGSLLLRGDAAGPLFTPLPPGAGS